MRVVPTAISGSRLVSSRGVPGTAGALARTLHDGRRVILGTWHVLYGDGADGTCRLADNTTCGAIYGKLGVVLDVHIDCAVASYDGDEDSVLRGHAPARIGQRVTKCGAATGTTRGVIVSVDASDGVVIDGRTMPTPRQLLVRSIDPTPFSDEGDSGALLLDDEGRAVGLLWGVNTRGEGVACPIEPVLYAMNITL
jgi:hypothetical protein